MAALLLALAALLPPLSAAAPQLARLSFAELQLSSTESSLRLRRALRAEGAVLLTDVPGYAESASAALEGLAACVEAGDEAVLSPALLKGGLRRATLAASSKQGAMGPLPAWAQKSCPGLAGSAPQLRGLVALLLQQFAQAADRALAVPEGAGLAELLRGATLLEHFHSYRKEEGSPVAPRPLEMHTDAGVMQALAVRWRKGADAAAGLELQLPTGEVLSVEEAAAGQEGAGGGLLLLVGQAAQEWLPRLHVQAAKHAVAARPGEGERLVYGVMVLPREDFVVAGNVSFGDWWRRAQAAAALPSGLAEAGEGCLSARQLQSRLRDAAETCPEGEMYCWMQCQVVPKDLPCGASRAVCQSDTTGKICPEDGTHDPSCKPACPAGGSVAFDIKGAGEAKVNGAYRAADWEGGKRAYKRQATYAGEKRAVLAWDDYWASEHFGQWVLFIPDYKGNAALYYAEGGEGEDPPEQGWKQGAGSMPLPQLVMEHGGGNHTPRLGEGFCNGVLTDMHMLGFAWAEEKNPCLVFLFSGWELTSALKFWLTALAAALAAVSAEWLVAVRRWESKVAEPRPAAGRARRALRKAGRLLLYALTRTVGYAVMLVTMTFSFELFAAVIVGLTVGYALFNMASPPGEDMTPCCQAGERNKSLGGGVPLRFRVSGMTCDACRSTVSRAVLALGSVLALTRLEVATGAMELLATDASAEEEIVAALEAVGFSAEPLAAPPAAPAAAGAGNPLAAPLVGP